MADVFGGRIVTFEWLLYVGDSSVGDVVALAPSDERLLPGRP